jgi:hypothetical protein
VYGGRGRPAPVRLTACHSFAGAACAGGRRSAKTDPVNTLRDNPVLSLFLCLGLGYLIRK